MDNDILSELREDNQLVSSWLIYYRERKRNVELERDEILYRTQQPGSDRVSSSTISDPTYQRAEELYRKTEHDMKWIETVDMVKRMVGPKKLLLLDLRQEEAEHPTTQSGRGRPGWVIWIQAKWPERYALLTGYPPDVCWLSDGMIRNMWSDIVYRCAILAAKRGLLTNDKPR